MPRSTSLLTGGGWRPSLENARKDLRRFSRSAGPASNTAAGSLEREASGMQAAAPSDAPSQAVRSNHRRAEGGQITTAISTPCAGRLRAKQSLPQAKVDGPRRAQILDDPSRRGGRRLLEPRSRCDLGGRPASVVRGRGGAPSAPPAHRTRRAARPSSRRDHGAAVRKRHSVCPGSRRPCRATSSSTRPRRHPSGSRRPRPSSGAWRRARPTAGSCLDGAQRTRSARSRAAGCA